MRIIGLTLAILIAAGGAAAPVQAQPQPQMRRLEVPANVSWKHARTDMILPTRVAGLVRREIADQSEDEADVMVHYVGDEDGVLATVFLFKTAVPDPALWFDRAAAAISFEPSYGLAGAPLPQAAPFVRPGASTESGLRVALDLPSGIFRSTALAVVPLGEHLLKIKISARRLDRRPLDALLTRFIEELRWPAPRPGERAAAPIEPCARPLVLRNARVVRSDVGNVLMDAVIGSIRPPEGELQLPVYCREPGATGEYGVYRPGGSRDSYLIALNDAGIALALGEATNLSELIGGGRGGRRVSMTLLDRESTAVLPSFNRLPPPAQAISDAFNNRGPAISVSNEPPRE
jgi:hypothetical protein